ncbi:hypothetical protein CJO75_17340 (plasmid) [Ralstonia solanacearum]|nr:hypothetical protein CJO75_17340 [Ralstonia solanacearum]AXW16539.1 hypothetical protein CJO84_17640 [Ralstonia solanacearum]AXW40185.1 hypothetical protein CJO89_18000 [Ralstonia solanacearum]AXW72975.1 hypothetical protein CJO96_17355 [Ralstonia solanacearum]
MHAKTHTCRASNMTKRPQNVCENCRYTWYPRGKAISLKCPKCGSGQVKIVQTRITGGGLLVGIALVLGAITLFGRHDKPVTEEPHTTPSTPEIATPQGAATVTPQTTQSAPSAVIQISGSSEPPRPSTPEPPSPQPQPANNNEVDENPAENQTPLTICGKSEGNFIAWNNCMWRECARPQFRGLEACKSKQRD